MIYVHARYITCLQFSSIKDARSLLFGAIKPLFKTRNPMLWPTNRHVATYDVVIAGGGMVGTAMACSLGCSQRFQNKRILLLEEAPKKSWSLTPKYSNRVCALNVNTRNLLSSIGAWEHISNMRTKAVKRMQVWESCSDAAVTYNNEDLSDLAYIVENDVTKCGLDTVLSEAAEQVEVVYGAKVKHYEFPSSHEIMNGELAKVHLEDGSTYHTRLLIGADGVKSLVRETMKVKYISWNYNQMGVVATLKLSEPTENNVAWQRFLTTGPIALLPLTEELCSLVWSTTVQHAKELLKMSSEDLVDSINKGLWDSSTLNPYVDKPSQVLQNLLDSLTPGSTAARQLPPSILEVLDGSTAAFPLACGHSTHYVRGRVALIGDAAHRVHPLAGQGVNLGFGDVKCLITLLEQAVYDGRDIGNLSHLLEYEMLRQRHNVPTMMAIDVLQKIYSTSATPLVLMRSLGTQVINAFTPFKNMIIQHASN